MGRRDIRELYIGAEFVPAHSRRSIEVVNPADGTAIGSIADSDELDVARAAEAADMALRTSGWADLAPGERAGYIRRLADEYEKRGLELVELVSRENGMPITFSTLVHKERPSRYHRYFADLADQLEADQLEAEQLVPTSAGYAIVRREPVGVAGLIIPWNGPRA
jgi:acyl-CoA reductase-like NAD-dependent aldehyde dehydrogenase